MSNMLEKVSNLILKLINDLEDDIGKEQISLKDKKYFTDMVNKLLPMILKLQKAQMLQGGNKICDNDLKIINDFLEKNINQKM
jgi:hypothetical protein